MAFDCLLNLTPMGKMPAVPGHPGRSDGMAQIGITESLRDAYPKLAGPLQQEGILKG